MMTVVDAVPVVRAFDRLPHRVAVVAEDIATGLDSRWSQVDSLSRGELWQLKGFYALCEQQGITGAGEINQQLEYAIHERASLEAVA